MASLIEQTVSVLAGIATGGVHYAINKSETIATPYIVFLRVASAPNTAMQGPSDLQNTRLQIDVYAKTVAELDALGKQIAATFAAWSVKNVPIMSVDFFETDTKLFRTTKDYSVWSKD